MWSPNTSFITTTSEKMLHCSYLFLSMVLMLLVVAPRGQQQQLMERELCLDDFSLMFFDTLMASLNAAFSDQSTIEPFDFFEYEDEDGEKVRVRTDEELSTLLADLTNQQRQPLRIHLKSTQRVHQQKSIVDYEGATDELFFEPDDLRLIERLSDGQFGSVYKALETRNDRLLAVKCISVDSANGTRQGLLNEIAILKKCAHPNIVKFHAALFVDNQLLICMELMDALSLDRYGQLPPPVLGAVSVAILDGLNYLWGLLIMHRDIKPSNFLVSSNGQVKLSDFGVSKQMAQSLAWSYVGTKVYMAPERLDGAVYSIASDVWSLGIALAEMALGHFPFAGHANAIESLVFKLESVVGIVNQPDLVAVGNAFDGLVIGCLAVNPKERLQAEEIYAHEFLKANRPMDQMAVSEFVAKANANREQQQT